jgi:hypothetical protein
MLISLPADSNADGMADVEDAGALVACCLDGSCASPHGEYSCDINRSGMVTADDLTRLIDLLNGGGPFTVWEGETYHDNGECG